MKPRTLARVALKNIQDGTFVFDCEERKIEALRVIEDLLHGKTDDQKYDAEDPIVELHIGVYVPNFDYPLVPTDVDNNPIVWINSEKNFVIPGSGTHIFRGLGLSDEYYYMGYLKSLSPFRDAIIKVDKYTDIEQAAYTFLCTMTRIIDKDYAFDHMISDNPLCVEYDVLLEHWQDTSKTLDPKEFEKEQKHLYMRWLQLWISKHGTNPETHMRVLRNPKKTETPQNV